MAQQGKRKHFYRSVRQGGRVRRVYVGTGETADLALETDALNKEGLQREAQAMASQSHILKELSTALDHLDAYSQLLTRAALLLAGYRQHARGQWRKTT